MNTKRPLSPHLQIYKPQLTSVLSISHRITGVILSIFSILIPIFLLLDRKIYFFKFNWLAVSFPVADKRLNCDIRKFLSDVAKSILEFSKIERD